MVLTILLKVTLRSVCVTVEDNWGNNASPVTIKMLDIDVGSSGSFLSQSQAVGLYVDVSANQLTDAASNYAAVFLEVMLVGVGAPL